jgi:Secretion system C-terminal sorting domain
MGFYKYSVLASLLMITTMSLAQQEVQVETAVDFYVTEEMSYYPEVDPYAIPDKEFQRGGMLSSKRQKKADHLKTAEESPTNIDPLIQEGGFTRSANSPIVSFDGVVSNVSPPDPTGAVGPNHIVEMTNSVWGVFDKSGNIASGFPKSINIPLGIGNGDPIVLYDREADRFLISQFKDPFSPSGSRFLVAISTTPDPTGTYHVFSFNPNGTIDYPHIGIYGNSYVITGNFSPTGRMYALNREKMINGDASAEMVSLSLPSYSSGTIFNAPQPAHSEGAGVAAGPVPILWFQDNAWPGVSNDHMKVWDFTVDWSNPGSATISAPLEINLGDFDSFIAGTGGDAFANLEQPETTQRIDALVHVLNFQTQRYDFGTHQSIVYNFAVEPVNNSKISGLRWGELRKVGAGNWELFQEGTFVDQEDNESVFMGGIAMDQLGNIAMGYIKTGATTHPSLYFTGRKDGDALGVMTLGPGIIVEGNTSVTTNSRYGDYAQLVRDPSDDVTFWYTAEYSGQPRKNRISSFTINDILSVDELDTTVSDLLIVSNDQRNFDVTLTTETTSDILRLSVFDITGKRIRYEQVEKGADNTYKSTLNLEDTASGVYIVSIGNAKTKLSEKIIVR